MIKRIEISGFKSIKNKAIIDFTRTKYKGLENTNVNNDGILKGAVFFGANASGKSTILHAIHFLFQMIIGNEYTDIEDNFCLFSRSKKIKMKYDFIFDDKDVTYELECINEKKKKSIYYVENLYVDNVLFMERFDSTAKRIDGEEKIYYNDIDSNVLFLRTEYFNKGFTEKCINDLFEFANNSIYLNMFRTELGTAARNTVLLRPYLEKYGTKDLNKFLEENEFVHRIHYLKLESTNSKVKSLAGIENNVIAVERTDIEDFTVDIGMESDGVMNLFNILPSYLSCMQKNSILLIDEFCSGFHNELEELLIKYFFKKSNQSQMFVVTHSTNVLSNTIYRPDQMYKIDFESGSGSKLYRVSESSPRPGQNIEKMVLGNAFGSSKGFFKRDEN